MAMFVAVGQALAEIHEKGLYRDSHATFEAYCEERWAMSRQHAYRTIDAARVVDVLSPTGDMPMNERTAREIAPVLRQEGEEAARELWARATADRAKPTAQVVAEHRNARAKAAPASQTRALPNPRGAVLQGSSKTLPSLELTDDARRDYEAWMALFEGDAYKGGNWVPYDDCTSRQQLADRLMQRLANGHVEEPAVRDFAVLLARALLVDGVRPKRLRRH